MRHAIVFCLCVLAGGCKRAPPAPAPRSAPALAKAAKAAEVEASGKVLPPGPRQVAFLSQGPCNAPGTLLGSNTTDLKTGGFFFELFAPQGTKAWLCGARLEGPTITALASDPQGPRTLQGTGEVEVRADLTLQPVAPFPAPADLLRLVK